MAHSLLLSVRLIEDCYHGQAGGSDGTREQLALGYDSILAFVAEVASAFGVAKEHTVRFDKVCAKAGTSKKK